MVVFETAFFAPVPGISVRFLFMHSFLTEDFKKVSEKASQKEGLIGKMAGWCRGNDCHFSPEKLYLNMNNKDSYS